MAFGVRGPAGGKAALLQQAVEVQGCVVKALAVAGTRRLRLTMPRIAGLLHRPAGKSRAAPSCRDHQLDHYENSIMFPIGNILSEKRALLPIGNMEMCRSATLRD